MILRQITEVIIILRKLNMHVTDQCNGCKHSALVPKTHLLTEDVTLVAMNTIHSVAAQWREIDMTKNASCIQFGQTVPLG